MSTVDTSSWNPDSDLNVEIEGIPLNSNASIAQTWQALRVLMAAVKGDGDAIKAMISVMEGATASADGTSGLVPQPLAGDQDKFLKGDGTWGSVPVSNLGTASRAVQTDANGDLAVSSVTATELGYLSGVTSAIQTQLAAKADGSGVVHNTGAETVSGEKTLGDMLIRNGVLAKSGSASGAVTILGGADAGGYAGAKIDVCGASHSSYPGGFRLQAGKPSTYKQLILLPDGTATWNGQAIQTSSDERLKTPLVSVPDEVLDAWGDVGWGQFQFLEAVGEKGDSARLHLGLIAQRVKAVFEARGLDACAYGILCHEVRPAVEDEPAVDLWTVRYAEALAMEAAFQRRRADRLEARVAVLEEKLK